MTERTPRKYRGSAIGRVTLAEPSDSVFRHAVGPVRRVTTDQVAPYRAPPQPIPRPRSAPGKPGADAIREAPETVAPTERLLYHRPGVPSKLLRKLRRGQLTIAAELDLHGHLAVQAEAALGIFLPECRSHGYRCIRIIHGKGLSSPGGRPVIKSMLNRWLREHPSVLAFCSARSSDGGTGAVYVLLNQP